MLVTLAWRNIWRQPHRAAPSLTSIALAGTMTVFLLALQQGAYGTMKERVLRLIDGFAQVRPQGYASDPDLRKTIAEPDALMAKLDALPAVTASAPRATAHVILLDVSFSVLLYAGLIVIVVFIIPNTLLMSVLERTHEFGMLMAIGMRPTQIGRMVWLEVLFLAGIPFPGAEALFSQWHIPSTLYPELNFASALAGPLAIALSIAVAGTVPYARVRGPQTISAMRAS